MLLVKQMDGYKTGCTGPGKAQVYARVACWRLLQGPQLMAWDQLSELEGGHVRASVLHLRDIKKALGRAKKIDFYFCFLLFVSYFDFFNVWTFLLNYFLSFSMWPFLLFGLFLFEIFFSFPASPPGGKKIPDQPSFN